MFLIGPYCMIKYSRTETTMPTNPYGRMELFRLSPQTGKALTRLNVMQGQILHGRVYKMEQAVEGSAKSVEGGEVPEGGGVAKIALGSHMIEAVVSKPLPEGAKVVLEVISLGEDSFTLRLISVDAFNLSGAESSGKSESSDQVQLSDNIQKTLIEGFPRPVSQAELSPSAKLVEIPKWADLPQPLAKVLRESISEGFIEPAGFAVKSGQIRISLEQVIKEIETGLAGADNSTAPEIKELAQSIKSILQVLKPVINNMPVKDTIDIESTREIAFSIKASADIFSSVSKQEVSSVQGKPESVNPAFLIEKPAAQVEKPNQLITTESRAINIQAGAKLSIVASEPKPTEVVQPKGTDQNQQQATSQTDAKMSPQPVTETSKANIQGAIELETTPLNGPILPGTVAAANLPQQPSAKPEFVQQLILKNEIPVADAKVGREITISNQTAERDFQISHAREILIGMRTIALLENRMARAKGWAVEESAVFGNHASRIAAISDALEGAIISPAMARAIDSPDLLPRFLMNLFFPNGQAEIAVLSDSRNREDADQQTKEGNGENHSSGIIRLRTESLGLVNVKLDYREADEERFLKGTFASGEDTSREIRMGLPTLEKSLDAHGIKTEGFRVIETGKARKQETIPKPGSEGGLDIKI
jgi:hypothetical protein